MTQTGVIGISGRSRDGRPLSYNRAPAADLSPWIARLFVTLAHQPAGQVLGTGIFNDTVFLRALIAGDWRAETARGPVIRSRGALFFGPQTRRMPLTVAGPIGTYGIALRPGAVAALGGPNLADWLDRIDDIGRVSGAADWESLFAPADDAAEPEVLLAAVEGRFRALLQASGAKAPAPLAIAFDEAAFRDPSVALAGLARHFGVSLRTLQRVVVRDFGMSPKSVLRRARALDMASQIIGFADRAEAEEHALRFYDQSHLNRDFRDLFGMTPSEFARRSDPIMALALEARQARRLEALGRLDSTAQAPWR
ncbi:AraC family transcriptional regulator [Aurantiacibacter luteus]|uniref:HTH araC/xylS-type domain-containing protein n=1 Tax=Aurantiacibacter luteus TaxID=1581420 RepID=A0A0G9MYS5_9SPHN|nr:helix-turn-helix domain-containing protein [Aurantiacibacter luteus]KLE34433.1 hypothetical protein AAW00_09425 [Aurantiacibacter luteus]